LNKKSSKFQLLIFCHYNTVVAIFDNKGEENDKEEEEKYPYFCMEILLCFADLKFLKFPNSISLKLPKMQKAHKFLPLSIFSALSIFSFSNLK
jgi:hypothetical protein